MKLKSPIVNLLRHKMNLVLLYKKKSCTRDISSGKNNGCNLTVQLICNWEINNKFGKKLSECGKKSLKS